MNVAEVMDLYEYNRWAHEQMLDSILELSHEQYERQIPGSFPSIRATLEHVLSAEVVWLSRWAGHSLGEAPDYSGVKDAAGLASLWRLFWHRQFKFLNSLSDEELAQPIAIRTRGGIETVQPLRETLLHVVNHASYHRGQIASLVRQVGGTPPSTDYFLYCCGKSEDAD